MIKILLIEDDVNLAFMLTDGMESEGFEVLHITRGEEVMDKLKLYNPDIILLDVNLKGKMDGFELSREIRLTSGVPIIFTTARTQIEDSQKGFEIGNVDYLKKPYGIRALVLRVNELLSRNRVSTPASDQSETKSGDNSRIGEYLFSAIEQSLLFGNELIHLAKNECAVLKLLNENKGHFVSKSIILGSVWDVKDLKQKEASLHNILSSLRSKLSKDKHICILTIPKTGFKLDDKSK